MNIRKHLIIFPLSTLLLITFCWKAKSQCMPQGGTASSNASEYCFDESVILSTSGFVQASGPDPCIGWGLWVIADPLDVYGGITPINVPPSGGDPIEDPNFVQYLPVRGPNISFPSLRNGVNYYIAPITFTDCRTSVAVLDPDCFDIGTPVQVYMNPEISSVWSINCLSSVATTAIANITISGGHSAATGSALSLTNNGEGTLSTNTTTSGGMIDILDIPNGGAIELLVADAIGCTQTIEIGPLDVAEYCPGCTVDAGDVEITQSGAGTTINNNGINPTAPFILCWEDQLFLEALQNGINPPNGCNAGNCANDCAPESGFSWSSHVVNPSSADPFGNTTTTGWSFGTYDSGNLSITNNNTHFNVEEGDLNVPGVSTNLPVDNEIWYLLTTMDYQCCGVGPCLVDYDSNDDGCYDLGSPISITYLKPISVVTKDNCYGVTLSLRGGYPEFFPGVYRVTLMTPSDAFLSAPSTGYDEPLIIQNIAPGAAWEVAVMDSNGCPATFSGTYNINIENDSLALVSLYENTDGENWIDPWILTETINLWEGIELYPGGCIKSINLQNRNLNGSIPNSIGEMELLEAIIIKDNPLLTGPLPNSIGNFSYLRTMDLSNNNLLSTIPPEIGDLCEIETLSINDNELTGCLPATLSQLEQLQFFDASNNAFSCSTYPSELITLCFIDSLDLKDNLDLPDFDLFCNEGTFAENCILSVSVEEVYCIDTVQSLLGNQVCGEILADSSQLINISLGTVIINNTTFVYYNRVFEDTIGMISDTTFFIGCAGLVFENCVSNGDAINCYRGVLDSLSYELLEFEEMWDCSLLPIDCETTATFEKKLEMDLHIFPNPSTDQFHIRLAEGMEIQSVACYDLWGHPLNLHSFRLNDILTIQLESSTKGVYLLEILHNHRSSIRKVIVGD